MFSLLLNILDWNISGSDLLGDTARLAILHVGATQLVQDLGLACVYVAEDTDHGGAERVVRFVRLIVLTAFLGEIGVMYL